MVGAKLKVGVIGAASSEPDASAARGVRAMEGASRTGGRAGQGWRDRADAGGSVGARWLRRPAPTAAKEGIAFKPF